MDPIESEGRTVAEAVDAALRLSGLRREQVEVTVLQESASGFIGLGTKPARVRLTEKRWGPSYAPPPAARRPDPPSPRALSADASAAACRDASALVVELLGLMKIAAPTASAAWDADLERVKIAVESQDAPTLVGRDGRVLEALQFLVTLMMSRGAATPIAVQVDALSYWEKREAAVLEAARRAADGVRASGRPRRLEPMDASMRRLIHRTFASDRGVTTVSEGEGPWRKIVIRPRAE